MAIYRLSVKIGKPFSGRAHYDYISGDGKYKRIGTDDDIQKSQSFNIPTWAKSDRDFWKEEEKKGDGYRKIELAIPIEFDANLRDIVVRDFIKKNLVDYPCSYAIHQSKDGKNPHAHIMFSERKIDCNRDEPSRENYFKKSRTRKDGTISGGYKKDVSIIKGNRKAWVLKIRDSWEQIQNEKLELYRLSKVSAKSLKEQGIDREPQIHVGSKGWRMKELSERWLHNQMIIERNHVNDELKILEIEQDNLNSSISFLEKEVSVGCVEIQQYEDLLVKEKNRLEEENIQKMAQIRLRETNWLKELSNYPKTQKQPYGANLSFYLRDSKEPLITIYQNGVVQDRNNYTYNFTDIAKHTVSNDGKHNFTINNLTWITQAEVIMTSWNTDIERIALEKAEKQRIEEQRKQEELRRRDEKRIREEQCRQEQQMVHLKNIEDRIFELSKANPSNQKGEMLAFYNGAIREKTSQFSSSTKMVPFSGIIKNSLIINKSAVGATLDGKWRKVQSFDAFDCTGEELKMIVSNVNERNGYKGPLKVIDDCDKLCSLSQNKGLER